MVFRQCGDCNQRWELGTKSTCACEAQLEPMVWMNKHGACISAVLRAVEAGAKDEYTIPLYTTPPLPEQEPGALRDALAGALGGVYGCSRTWSAWGIGTMSQCDFYPAAESDELLDELVQAVATVTPPLPVQEPHNFCPRCGKRAQGVLGQPQIHTCTPPLWGHT